MIASGRPHWLNEALTKTPYYIPILSWLPNYSRESFCTILLLSCRCDFDLLSNCRWFVGRDLLAGITLGIMIIPQSIAYATLVGVPPEYGLFTALVYVAITSIFLCIVLMMMEYLGTSIDLLYHGHVSTNLYWT
mgnify:FL=1